MYVKMFDSLNGPESWFKTIRSASVQYICTSFSLVRRRTFSSTLSRINVADLSAIYSILCTHDQIIYQPCTNSCTIAAMLQTNVIFNKLLLWMEANCFPWRRNSEQTSLVLRSSFCSSRVAQRLLFILAKSQILFIAVVTEFCALFLHVHQYHRQEPYMYSTTTRWLDLFSFKKERSNTLIIEG